MLFRGWMIMVAVLVPAVAAQALTPGQVLVLVNSEVDESVALGRYYCHHRGIPEKNLIALPLPTSDNISLDNYRDKIVIPLRNQISERQLERHIRAIAVFRGVPFRIVAPPATQPASEAQKHVTAQAAVDSELSLLWFNGYEQVGWQPNPLYWQLANQLAQSEEARSMPPVLMVSRIDGPTLASALRLIKDAISAETLGLDGTFYIDAGGRVPGMSPEDLRKYDANFKELAQIIKTQTDIPVVLNEAPEVFQPGEAPDAALYVGWYSLRKYVPAFEWNRGAVGFHVASWEAMHIRDKDSTEWVPSMLLGKGVAGTLGATDEPFLQAFPLPQHFFPLLLTGKVTLAEAYWRTVMHVSWRMMLIGDPLYNPFKNKPRNLTLPPGLMPPAEAGMP